MPCWLGCRRTVPIQYTYKGTDYYYNERGQKIDPLDDNWPVLAYIELKNPTSNFGFRIGDIVLGCNDWYMRFYDSIPYKSLVSKISTIILLSSSEKPNLKNAFVQKFFSFSYEYLTICAIKISPCII